MVWGCFSSNGTGDLHVIENKMNAAVYQDILREHMLPSARRLIGRQYYFQHDNDPKHTAKSTAAFLKARRVKVLQWPSQSPDLNPIEMLWTDLKTAVVAQKPRNISDLKDLCKKEWSNITRE